MTSSKIFSHSSSFLSKHLNIFFTFSSVWLKLRWSLVNRLILTWLNHWEALTPKIQAQNCPDTLQSFHSTISCQSSTSCPNFVWSDQTVFRNKTQFTLFHLTWGEILELIILMKSLYCRKYVLLQKVHGFALFSILYLLWVSINLIIILSNNYINYTYQNQ